MGRNIDMIRMLGEFDVTCPHCGFSGSAVSYCLEDIDVDGKDFNPEDGVWQTTLWCNKCEEEFLFKLKVTAKQIMVGSKQS
jgi:DNA-directed RNA polymerase subunit RPC12/RpoP